MSTARIQHNHSNIIELDFLFTESNELQVGTPYCVQFLFIATTAKVNYIYLYPLSNPYEATYIITVNLAVRKMHFFVTIPLTQTSWHKKINPSRFRYAFIWSVVLREIVVTIQNILQAINKNLLYFFKIHKSHLNNLFYAQPVRMCIIQNMNETKILQI